MKFDGHYIKLKDNMYILYNNYNEIIGEHKTFLGLIRTFTDNNAVYQYLARFFRNNKTVKIPTAQKIYLTYKEFDGWYARYLD